MSEVSKIIIELRFSFTMISLFEIQLSITKFRAIRPVITRCLWSI